jgi:hypothetical protein
MGRGLVMDVGAVEIKFASVVVLADVHPTASLIASWIAIMGMTQSRLEFVSWTRPAGSLRSHALSKPWTRAELYGSCSWASAESKVQLQTWSCTRSYSGQTVRSYAWARFYIE